MAAEIFGNIFSDHDRSGNKTGGDESLQGWRVYVDVNRDGAYDVGEPTSVSNARGEFSIGGLAGGTHPVALQLEPEWIPTSALARNVRVQADKKTRADFFVFAGGDLTGTVWSDLDNDGIRDADPTTGEYGDPGLAGWTVFLDLNDNAILDPAEPATVTDVTGRYRFADLEPNVYKVVEVLPGGWEPARQQSDSDNAEVFSLQETTLDFGNFSASTGGIQGIVFNDLNLDGVLGRDAATGDLIEPGLTGFRVFLDADGSLTFDEGEVSVLSDSDGEFVFQSVPLGTYDVVVELPSRWNPTPGATVVDSVVVTGGDVTTTKDFSLFTVLDGAIRGLVWNDSNRNGVRDFHTLTGAFVDPVLPGWTVFVDLNRDSVRDPAEPVATTGADGRYFFPDLQVGTYDVREIVPPGWEVAPTFSEVVSVVVNSGQTSVAPDFVNFDSLASAPGSIAGEVWDDRNGNGIREAGDTGLSGRTVYIDVNLNGMLDAGEPETVTGATGAYAFSGVSPGSITIRAVAQAGWTPTTPVTNSRTVTLRGGQNLTGILFGQYQRQESGITGTVFADKDQDGVRDAGEPGLAGVTVYLDTNDNALLDAGEPSVTTSSDRFYTPATDEAGTYAFTHLAAGSYSVRVILPDILSATPAERRVHAVTVAAAQRVDNVDTAGVYRAAQIRGTKYVDVNRNLQRDGGEGPIAGATVYIDSNRNGALDADEPTCLTASDGTYVFADVLPGSYVVRSVAGPGYSHSAPNTVGGTLWPVGTSNPASGLVTPDSITVSLAEGASHRETVSITLPDTGSLTDMVDVFLLFDDTGSFVSNSPIVRGAFPDIMATLQAASPGTNFGFGVGRFEEYANFGAEYASGRPFILNQPIVASSTDGYVAAIQAALNRTTPGYGGDGPETGIEALYQLVTGRGFDGNDNGTVLDSGPAGPASTQLTPGSSGDVPSFASFVADVTNGVLPAAGTVGGAGFRSGALPIVLLATDIGVAYQPKGETVIVGAGGVALPASRLTQQSRATTPYGSGAGLQETITALNALGALVIGLGTNPDAAVDPRQQLEAISALTGAVNRSDATIANGTTDAIAPGDPLYFQIATGFASSVAGGITQAIQNAVTNVAVDIEVRASDPRVRVVNHTGVIPGVGAGITSTFDVEFIGDGRPHRFDLQFVRAGTQVVIGSVPVVIGTPVGGDSYHYDEVEDGEYEIDDDFGAYDSSSSSAGQDPTIATGGSLTAVSTTYGTASGTSTVTVEGTFLTGDVVATAPAGFEVSSDGSTFGATATFVQAGGSAVGTLFVRLSANADAGTYSGDVTLTSPGASTLTVPTVAGTVARRALTITGVSAATRPYDGTTAASVSGTAGLFGLLGRDEGLVGLSGTATGTFNSKDAVHASTVAVSGFVLTGSGRDNYTLSLPVLPAGILARALVVVGGHATRPVNAANPALSATVAGLVAGETAATVLTGAPAVTTAATQQSPIGTYAVTVGPGTLAAVGGNYTFDTFVDGVLTVTNPAVKVTGLFVRGSGWTDAYFSRVPHLVTDGEKLGWRLRDGTNQLATSGSEAAQITWNNVNTVSVRFDQPIALPAATAVRLIRGTAGGSQVITPTGVRLLAGGTVAQFTLPSPLANGKHVVSIAATGITDAAGSTVLDGEWAQAHSTFAAGSGDGIPGGAFHAAFNVLVGDLNPNGQANTIDLAALKGLLTNPFGTPVTPATFRYDITGNGLLNSTDIAALRGALTSLSPFGVALSSFPAAHAPAATLPAVSVADATGITASSATLGGTVTADGGEVVLARGVVLVAGGAGDPTLGGQDVFVFLAAGTTGPFALDARGLTPSKSYRVRAFVTTNVGTAYSDTVAFTTRVS